jgi:hypothetical protein
MLFKIEAGETNDWKKGFDLHFMDYDGDEDYLVMWIDTVTLIGDGAKEVKPSGVDCVKIKKADLKRLAKAL